MTEPATILWRGERSPSLYDRSAQGTGCRQRGVTAWTFTWKSCFVLSTWKTSVCLPAFQV